MKTWVTYITAILMGFATTLLFKDILGSFSIFQSVFYFLINLSIALFIPIVLITFAAGIASIKKERSRNNGQGSSIGTTLGLGIIGWSLVTTILLPLSAILVYKLFPTSFPITSTAGSDTASLQSLVSNYYINAISQIYPNNPFAAISYTSTFIFPVVIIAWIFGLSLTPSCDVIRPAYTVMNSLSEVMYRISRVVTLLGGAATYFAATYFFMYLYRDKTVLVAPRFLLVVLLATLFVLIVLVPFLYGLVSGFRKNPYKVLFRSISSLTLGLVTGNIITADLVGESVSRQNGGSQKRVVSVSIPIYMMIARGGTAFIATLSILMLIQAATKEIVSLPIALIVAGGAMLTSLLSSAFIGFELMAITYITLSLLKINLYGAEIAILGVLPLLSGLGVLLDNLIHNLGAVLGSHLIGTDDDVLYKDTI